MKLIVAILSVAAFSAYSQSFNYPPLAGGGSSSSGATTIPGSDGQQVYNNAGALGAATGLTYNSSTLVSTASGLGVTGQTSLTAVSATSIGVTNRFTIRPELSFSSRMVYAAPSVAAQFQIGDNVATGAGFAVWPATGSACVGYNCSLQATPLNGTFMVGTSDTRIFGLAPKVSIGYATAATTPTAQLDVAGTISATFARLSSSTTACATAANIGDIVRSPARNTYAVCVGALAAVPLVTATTISPSAL